MGEELEHGLSRREVHHSATLSVTRARKVLQYPYRLHGHTLETTDSAKYLGVAIKKDLGWNTHVDNICARANKTLGFLWRNLKIGLTSIKQTAYKSFLRPNLEYTSIVWDPHTQHAIDKIYNEELPDMSLGATTTALASRTYSELQWPSLQQCRHIAWLTTCTKSTTTMSVPLD